MIQEKRVTKTRFQWYLSDLVCAVVFSGFFVYIIYTAIMQAERCKVLPVRWSGNTLQAVSICAMALILSALGVLWSIRVRTRLLKQHLLDHLFLMIVGWFMVSGFLCLGPLLIAVKMLFSFIYRLLTGQHAVLGTDFWSTLLAGSGVLFIVPSILLEWRARRRHASVEDATSTGPRPSPPPSPPPTPKG